MPRPLEISTDLRRFLHSLRSLWTIELLLILHRAPERRWSIDDMVIELRGSRALVDSTIATLHGIGLVERQPDGAYTYASQSPPASLVHQLCRLHAERPLAIAQAIHDEPNRKLRAFSDAFRLNRD